jgi:hypothetical protein
MSLHVAAALLFVLEALVTVAAAHQHHSESRWEISATYFGSAVGYILERLIIWLPMALLSSLMIKVRYRSVLIWRLVGVSLIIELSVTAGSMFLRARDRSYGIFYTSFWTYLIARGVFWLPLICAFLLIFSRRPNRLLRRNSY